MVQKQEQPRTPKVDDTMVFATNREAAVNRMPQTANTGQHLQPK